MPKVRARLEVVKGTKQRPYPREMRHGRLLVVDGMTRKNNRRGPEGVCPKGGTMTPDEKRIVEWLYEEVDAVRIFAEQSSLHSGMARMGRKLIKAEHYKQIAQSISRGDHRKD